MSRRSSSSSAARRRPVAGSFAASAARRRAGFSLLEMLVAAAIMGLLLGLIGQILGVGLGVRKSETQRIELQENLRTAMQVMSQDLRASSHLHLWNNATCGATSPCSRHDRVAVVAVDGSLTAVPEMPGNSYSNSSETLVCDARPYNKGDIALLVNTSGHTELFEITGVQRQRDFSKPCSGPPAPNADKVQHTKHQISGQWSPNPYLMKATVVSYALEPDPLDVGRTVLYRRTGMTGGGPQAVVAFNVTDLAVGYGIPMNPNDPASQLIFYDSLAAARAALGSGYTDQPTGTGVYLGKLVRAVRVELRGESAFAAAADGTPATYTLTQTVDVRR